MGSVVWILLIIFVVCVAGDKWRLESWRVQNSVKVSATPKDISTAGFNDNSWYPAVVPYNGTVMAVLLQNQVYENITQNVNLLNVNSSQFNTPWWYRTEFRVDSSPLVTVTFKGINYKANIWLNGNQISTVNYTIGTFRYFTFDVSQYITFNDLNAFALEIYKPYNEIQDVANVTGLDLAITFVDWAPPPPDSNMGLWQEVVVETVPEQVVIQYPMVETLNLTSDYSTAVLAVMFELANYGNTVVNGTVTLQIQGIGSCQMEQSVIPGINQYFFLYDSGCEMLKVSQPLLWWPAQMGSPYLHTLTLEFAAKTGGTYSLSTSFGIRTATSYVDSNQHRVYQVNGKNILIRGAGWAPDLFQRTDLFRLETEIQFVLHMNLNAIRLEGKFESDTLFDLADVYGVLMMPGICCCDSWQDWGRWDAEHYMIAEESVRSQVKRLRIHPSILVFLYSSDLLPPEPVEQLYLSVFAEEFWPNALLASAGEFESNITGPTGVKMSGPYSWVSPNYWLLDTDNVGGAFGFLTEGGPGESPLTWDSFVQTFSPENYWPINNVWNFHCGAWYGNFNNLNRFTGPLNIRYGMTTSAQDYIEKSQLAAYEGQRAMFEGYSRNKYTSTGVIQWMLNNAFTEMIWHLYDSYLVAGGGYYGSKKACEPLHIMYSYNDGSIWVVNSMYQTSPAVQAEAIVYNVFGQPLYNHSAAVAPLDADSAYQIFVLPNLTSLTTTYFLKLTLNNGQVIVSDNFYWLSTVPDVPEFENSTWYNTPCSQYADFTLLQKIPEVTVTSSFSVLELSRSEIILTASLANPNPTIAFFIHLTVVDKNTGANILPVFWDDNYITLLPHETRQVNVSFYKPPNTSQQPDLLVDWWNDGSSFSF